MEFTPQLLLDLFLKRFIRAMGVGTRNLLLLLRKGPLPLMPLRGWVIIIINPINPSKDKD